ncbi:MAG: DUF1517 domain-containing protein, partial [Cyanobacteria bacterium J06639_1]
MLKWMSALTSRLRPWLKPILAVVLAIAICLAPASEAQAARSGGRIGGGSFRRPSYSAPRTMPRGDYGGGYRGGYGGGFGLPLYFPLFWGGGGGGLFTLLLVLGAGSFVLRAVRSAREGADGAGGAPTQTQVAEVQVGLLASARSLQKEIDALALSADASDSAGLSKVLQEVSLALVRNEDYWVYGRAAQETKSLNQAEQYFNQRALQERGKVSVETLTNVDDAIAQLSESQKEAPARRQNSDLAESDVGEYLVVTLLVAFEGKSLPLPNVDDADTLRRCLMQIGGTSSDRLMAMEVLWTPQAEGDT